MSMDRRPWNVLLRARDWTEWLWARVAEPKIMTLLSSIAYLVAALAGGYAIINQPSSLTGMAGEVSMYLTAGALTFGGFVGAPTSLLGEWKIERFAGCFIMLGALIYLGVVLILHIQGEGNRLLQAGFISIVLLAALARTVHVWQRPIAPKAEKIIDPVPLRENHDDY